MKLLNKSIWEKWIASKEKCGKGSWEKGRRNLKGSIYNKQDDRKEISNLSLQCIGKEWVLMTKEQKVRDKLNPLTITSGWGKATGSFREVVGLLSCLWKKFLLLIVFNLDGTDIKLLEAEDRSK
jgi:hypothetical protein